MDIETAKTVLVRTHLAAIARGIRASGVHLESGPGVGKTDAGGFQYAAEVARQTNEPVGLVPFMLATITSADVNGFMMPTKPADGVMGTMFSLPPWYPVTSNIWVVEPDGTWHKPRTWKGPIPRIGVLFLDEFSQAEDDVKKPAAELVYKGSVGTTELPLNWRVVSAGNRMSDRSGVMREMMFIVNRRMRIQVEGRVDVWASYVETLAQDDRPHYLTITFARKNPDVVFRDAVPDGSDPYCTPRSLCLLDRDLKALRSPEDIANDRLPTDAVAREVAVGWIGAGSAAQFFTHIKYADELPDMADIETHPKTAKVPANKDAQMVAAYMLIHHITAKNGRAVLQYLTRLTIEMQVLAISTIYKTPARVHHILNQPELAAWLVKHKDLLVASRS